MRYLIIIGLLVLSGCCESQEPQSSVEETPSPWVITDTISEDSTTEPDSMLDESEQAEPSEGRRRRIWRRSGR